jgi:hypothetical protein
MKAHPENHSPTTLVKRTPREYHQRGVAVFGDEPEHAPFSTDLRSVRAVVSGIERDRKYMVRSVPKNHHPPLLNSMQRDISSPYHRCSDEVEEVSIRDSSSVGNALRDVLRCSPLAKRVVWEIQIWPFFVARKSPKIAKNLFDATPYPATTSDPIRAKNKNITGFEPRDLIDLDS